MASISSPSAPLASSSSIIIISTIIISGLMGVVRLKGMKGEVGGKTRSQLISLNIVINSFKKIRFGKGLGKVLGSHHIMKLAYDI